MIEHGPGVEEARRAGEDATPEQVAAAVRDHYQMRRFGTVDYNGLALSGVHMGAIERAEDAGAIVGEVQRLGGYRKYFRLPEGPA